MERTAARRSKTRRVPFPKRIEKCAGHSSDRMLSPCPSAISSSSRRSRRCPPVEWVKKSRERSPSRSPQWLYSGRKGRFRDDTATSCESNEEIGYNVNQIEECLFHAFLRETDLVLLSCAKHFHHTMIPNGGQVREKTMPLHIDQALVLHRVGNESESIRVVVHAHSQLHLP